MKLSPETRLGLFLTLALALCFSTSSAQVFTSSPSMAQIQAQIPQPANAAPPSESSTAAVGAQTTRYSLEDHVHPRITRAQTVSTVVGGTFSGTWNTALSTAPTLILTPISAGGVAITCQLTATPTTTTFAGRCWTAQTTTLNLTIITAGLSLNPVIASAAGISVQVIALPPTQ